jgi:hypothetical protein
MCDGCPVFFTKHVWNHIQELLAKNNSKTDWWVLKQIDEQLGGHYPHNTSW